MGGRQQFARRLLAQHIALTIGLHVRADDVTAMMMQSRCLTKPRQSVAQAQARGEGGIFTVRCAAFGHLQQKCGVGLAVGKLSHVDALCCLWEALDFTL